jgi:hypothetical protein
MTQAHRKTRNQRAALHHEVSRWLVARHGVIAIEDLNLEASRAEGWPVRSMMRVGTPSSLNSHTRQNAPGGGWSEWMRAGPARHASAEPLGRRPWRIAATPARGAGCRRAGMWSARKSFSNGPGPGLQAPT